MSEPAKTPSRFQEHVSRNGARGAICPHEPLRDRRLRPARPRPLQSTGLFDLAWQHEPPLKRRTPANTSQRSRKDPHQRQGPNWLSPIRQSIKSGQCLIEPLPRNPTQPKPCLSPYKQETCPYGHQTQKDKTPTRQPVPRMGKIRTTPRQRNARRTRQRRLETPPMEQRHTLRLGDRKNRIHTNQPETPTSNQHRPAQPEPPDTI